MWTKLYRAGMDPTSFAETVLRTVLDPGRNFRMTIAINWEDGK